MSRFRRLGVLVSAGLVAAPIAFVDATATSAASDPPTALLDSVLVDQTSREVAPGLDLVSYQRLEPLGWNTGNVLVADLDTPTLSMDVVNSGKVANVATTKDQIAGRDVVAAVNGDFFDINASGAPVGNDVSREYGVLNGTSQATPAFTIADGVAAIEMLSTDGEAAFDGATHQLGGVNTPHLDRDAIGLYTPLWGDYTLRRPLGGPDSMPAEVAEVTVVDGVVTEVDDEVDQTAAIPAQGEVLVGREAGARTLLDLAPGDPVEVTVQPSSPADVAVSGNVQLVDDGIARTFPDKTDHARTAVGLSQDGSTLYVATVDAAQGDSHGQQLDEMADLMVDLGAYNAVNLDGGGSSTMYARLAGTSTPTLLNRPADGSERRVANALAFFSTVPGNQLSGVATRPAIARPTIGEDGRTLMPGLRRTIVGTGLDPNLAAMSTTGTFTVEGDGARLASSHDGTAVVVGSHPGQATVTYRSGGYADSTPLSVVGPLDHLVASGSHIHLAGPSSTAPLSLTAYDADGNAVPVEADDVTVDVGAGFAIEPAGLGGFTVSTTVDSGSATARLRVGDETVDVALTAGSVSRTVADFSDASAWVYGTDRAAGTLTPTEGPDGRPGLGMTFDFTLSSNTRGSYAIAPQEITLPGQPQQLTLWINGDAQGEWPRLQVRSAQGVTFNLDGPLIDWTGWRRVSFPVPPGTAYPLTFQRIRILEIRSTVSYHGALAFSDLAATLAPDVELPVPARVDDPALVTNGTAAGRPQQIAVMSDAQFTADNPDGPLVQAARRTLREIVAARPDLLVIDGDFVDRGEAADLALAKRVLDEEIPSSLPYVYVPGNHEIMGSPAADFSGVFGPTRTARTVAGTRVITLQSSAGTLHAGGLAQVHFLESELAAAADDPNVTGVLVFFHHPPDDFLPDKASQLGDRFEAAAVQRILARFQDEARKSVAMVNAHVGAFHTTSVDGVTYVTNGNSGKSPASTPDNGGFTGWTMLGIDPSAGLLPRTPKPAETRTRWLRAETRARVDDLRLDVPAQLAVGDEAAARATVVQDGGRLVPVGWPVSAMWSGQRVAIAGADPEQEGAVVRLDPAAGTLTALRPGRAIVEVTVNGVRRSTGVTVR